MLKWRKNGGNIYVCPKVTNHKETKLTDKLHGMKTKLSPLQMLALIIHNCRKLGKDSLDDGKFEHEKEKEIIS